jgi:hypothetical protein
MDIMKRKFRWIGHTLRKDDEQPSKVVAQWNPQGSRGRERPRNRWRRPTLREAGRIELTKTNLMCSSTPICCIQTFHK